MKLNVKIPTWATVAAGAALGVLGALNIAVFGFGSPWTELITFACAGAASLGVAPLTHGALRNALHISYQTALGLAALSTTACAAVTTASGWDDTVKGIVVGVLTAAAGVLAGPEAFTPVPSPPVPSPEPAPAPSPPVPVPSPPTPTPVSSKPSIASPSPKRAARKSGKASSSGAPDDSRA